MNEPIIVPSFHDKPVEPPPSGLIKIFNDRTYELVASVVEPQGKGYLLTQKWEPLN